MTAVRRVLAVLVALVIASFAAPAVASGADSVAGSEAVCAYEIPPHPAGPTYTTTERGPPATYNDATIFDADDLRLLGASACLDATAPRATYDYTDLARFVKIASRSRGAEVQAGQAEPSSFVARRSDVAANGGARTPGVIRAGELKFSGVPKGAVGKPVKTGRGLEYQIPRGDPELDPRVASIRVMDPVTKGAHQYPNGYVSYMNSGGQVFNPVTGRTLKEKSDPFWHIELP